MSIILKTTNLCKSFSRQTVVNNISLNIEKNSVYECSGTEHASTLHENSDRRIERERKASSEGVRLYY